MVPSQQSVGAAYDLDNLQNLLVNVVCREFCHLSLHRSSRECLVDANLQ